MSWLKPASGSSRSLLDSERGSLGKGSLFQPAARPPGASPSSIPPPGKGSSPPPAMTEPSEHSVPASFSVDFGSSVVIGGAYSARSRSRRAKRHQDERTESKGGVGVARGGKETATNYTPQATVDEKDTSASTTWIEIVLLDDDKKPVPNAAYRIECADGTVLTGQTNGSGKARETGVPKGDCKVSFPQLNAPDWKKVG